MPVKKSLTAKGPRGQVMREVKPMFEIPRHGVVRTENLGNARTMPHEDDPDSDDDSVIFLGERALQDVIFVKERSLRCTVREKRGAGNLFISLPLEIHQHIADFLPTDADVARFAQVCKKAAASVSSSVWRKRFVRTFDMVEGLTPQELAKKYAFRRKISKKWTCFDLGRFRRALGRDGVTEHEINQIWCLQMLKSLILDSNARKTHDADGNEIVIGLNFKYICDFITHQPEKSEEYTDIMEAVLNTDNDWDTEKIISARSDGALVMVIQLCLTSFALEPLRCNARVCHFDLSQYEVYASPAKQPVFLGKWKQEVNVRWLLHVVNFFKFHLKTGNGEGLLTHEFENLEPSQLPQPWLGKIKAGTQQLGNHWKGVYTFLSPDELSKIRNKDKRGIFVDELDGGEFFQDLSIFFDDGKFSATDWPRPWERILQSDPFGETGAAGKRGSLRSKPMRPEYKHFYGTSKGNRTAHFYGRLHAIPPQQDIPGFQRVSMMKFFPTMGAYDPVEVWAYEGCVLPGGRIIVGRWWDPSADPRDRNVVFSGPFVFWNVDNSAALPLIDGKAALEFLASIHAPLLMGF